MATTYCYGRARLGELPQPDDRALDVLVDDVAETPQASTMLGRRQPGVGGDRCGVAGDHLYPGQPGVLGGGPRRGRDTRVEFDQLRGHVVAAGMRREHPDHVASLARAEADQPNRTVRALSRPSARRR